MSDYSLDSLAYLKVILHAAKYPASTVTGLLVGTVTANKVTVQDAIPLLHHWTPLSPMMEAGLQLAEVYAKGKGQVFVGLYVANRGIEDTSLPTATMRVADALKRELPQAFVLVLDNQKLGSIAPAFIPYFFDKSWSPSTLPSPRISLSDPSIPTQALKQARSGLNLIADFDEHLEDNRRDWLVNPLILVE